MMMGTMTTTTTTVSTTATGRARGTVRGARAERGLDVCVFYSRLPGRRRRGRRWSGDDARVRDRGGGWMAAVTRGDGDGRDAMRCDATRGWRRANDARDGWMRSCACVRTRGNAWAFVASSRGARRVERIDCRVGSRIPLSLARARGREAKDGRARTRGGEARRGGWIKKIVLPFSSLRRRFVGVARRSRANECM